MRIWSIKYQFDEMNRGQGTDSAGLGEEGISIQGKGHTIGERDRFIGSLQQAFGIFPYVVASIRPGTLYSTNAHNLFL
jgi:hypothetical protein